jgi:hypothetical protein
MRAARRYRAANMLKRDFIPDAGQFSLHRHSGGLDLMGNTAFAQPP